MIAVNTKFRGYFILLNILSNLVKCLVGCFLAGKSPAIKPVAIIRKGFVLKSQGVALEDTINLLLVQIIGHHQAGQTFFGLITDAVLRNYRKIDLVNSLSDPGLEFNRPCWFAQ